ncbi:MAG: amidohydrolase family protein [Candidatus Bathyarchaeia archaeon]
MKILAEAMILAGEEMETIKRGYIAIEDGRIVRVGSGSPSVSGVTVSNLRGCLVVPGLINAHTHVGDSVAKDVAPTRGLRELVQPPLGLKHKILRETPPERLVSAMRDTIRDMLRCGVTTFADFREGGLEGVRLLKAAAEGLGIRVLTLGRPNFQFSETALQAGKERLPTEMMEEVEGILNYAEGLGLSSPNEFTDHALQEIAEHFKGRVIIATHVAEHQMTIDTSIRRSGLSDVERALRYLKADFLVHLTKAGGGDLRRVREAGVPVVCCPRANAALGLGFPPIGRLLELGVTVALGSDNVMVNSPDLFREMEFTTRLIRAEAESLDAFTPRESFKMVTINAARLLGLGDRIGSIEEGKFADLVIIDADAPNLRPLCEPLSALVNRVRPDNVKAVLVGGEVVYGRLRGY